jgi:transposase
MNLKQSKRDKGRIYLSIVHGYRDKETKKVRTKTIQSLGYLDDLEKEHPGIDVVEYYRKVARQMTDEEKLQRKISLTIDMNEELPENTDNRKNLGYAAILKIYHDLKLNQYLNNIARNHEFKFNSNSIMILLIVSRILSPGSKKKAYDEKHRYFERFDFAWFDVYRALSHFAALSDDVQRHIHEQITSCYGPRNTKTIYYDVTNFYFEIDQEDELRKRGYGKKYHKGPIVQMGLAMDGDGIPLHYELFPGNTLDKQTFRSVIGDIYRKYDTGRIIVVADMGIITGDNIFYLTGGEKRDKTLNGYVMSSSVRGGTDELKSYVLDKGGYHCGNGKSVKEGCEFMIKSRKIAREINVTMQSGKTRTKIVYEKQVVFWGKKYADKAKMEREKTLQKTAALMKDPAKYKKATSHGAAKYVQRIDYDKDTGEEVDTGKALILDVSKILEEEKYDGYYSIVTSEKEMSDMEIRDTYKGLWEIEESFRVTKDTLESQPVYLSRPERIDAHFLTCFISLTILRLLEKFTDRRFSSKKIVQCLNRISCSHEEDNIYMFDYRSEVSEAIGDALGIDFKKKRMRLNEIKNIVATSKK